MKTKIFLILLIGMITSVSPLQGGAQNPWNYQRTIRVTDSLVEVFEGDGMTILLESYTGAVKGTSIWPNLLPVSPSELERTRFSIKNGENFWIDMNTIPGLTEIWGLGGSHPVTLHSNNMLEVWGAGIVTFHYTANGEQFYVSSHVNHFGVTQWDGADLPSETILVVEEGSELSGTLSPEGALYLAESEVIGVPEWKTDGIWWCNVLPNGNYVFLFSEIKEVTVGSLIDKVFSVPEYGNEFLLEVAFDDGTSNGLQYWATMDYYTLIDHRSVLVETITLSPSNATLTRGEQLQITATVLPSHATHPDLLWSSSDPEVATVNQTGLVTALSPGTTTIRATAQDGSGCFGEAELTVVLPEYQLIFSCGEGGTLTALVGGEYLTSPAQLEEGTVVDFTASPDVNYALDAWWLNGEVVDTIYLNVQLEMLQNNEILVTFKLDVVGIEEIILSPSQATLIKEQQLQLTATVLPSNATNPALLWSSSDLEVATVNQSGLVTAVYPGTATIRATAQDGSGCFGEAIIEVVAPSYQLTFSWGEGGILSALVDGEWITSPAMLEEGTVVDFTASPDVNYALDAWWLNGEVVDTIYLNVQVEMLQNNEILVTFKLDVVGIEEIILSPSKAILIKEQQLQLTATILPSNATNPELIWSSSDPEVASVDQSGLVTAFRPGKALIRAVAVDGSGVLSTPSIIEVKEISSPFSSQRSQYIEIEDILGRKVPSKGYPSIRMIKMD